VARLRGSIGWNSEGAAVPANFDYLIVGAGAAGCVLASRLSADPAVRVMLIEAGPDHPPGREHSAILDPYPISLGYPEFSWPDVTAEVGADLGHGEPRFSRHYLQGYGVGGGSNIQGMVAFRGNPNDYDAWREAGASGWGWDDVLPYFKKLENDLDFRGPMHGTDGPIPIRRIKPAEWAPFAKVFAACAEARGYARIEDLNANSLAGVGSLPMANLPNQRVSAAMGYLNATVRQRENLTIRANTCVERIEFRGRTAVGVSTRQSSATESFIAREIIISAGALHSPAILMRSGIGAGSHLQDCGINVVHDLTGVGQNLMNHAGLSIPIYLRPHAVQPEYQRGFGQCCLRICSGIEGPDNDLLVAPINRTAWHPLGRRVGGIAVEVHKIHSRGEVRLCRADPNAAPEVKFNLLTDERDLARLMVGLRVCLEILSDTRMAAVATEVFTADTQMVNALWRRSAGNWLQASLIAMAFSLAPLRRKLIAQSMLNPHALLDDRAASRGLALSRANPPHHVSCTCRMGRPSDRDAVLDAECRVRGVENLRVIDASIMPFLVRANTHLPVMMIAERMADRIRAVSS
jgi:5-(hydroxymethyl)furfural/furfural oxidase